MAKKQNQQQKQPQSKAQSPAGNPFAQEQAKIVHLEKNCSHYEYCRMQMHDIEAAYRRTFIGNTVLCIFIALLSVFQIYIQIFGALSMPFVGMEGPGAMLGGGIFQIIFALIIAALGYLAWANVHTLNVILTVFYGVVALMGVIKLDYCSAILGVVGLWLYIYSMGSMQKEGALAEMEGYPDFRDRFDISTSDIVVQTLMAHRGEHKKYAKSTPRSLRKRKKQMTDAPTEDAAAQLAEQIAKSAKQRAADAGSEDGGNG